MADVGVPVSGAITEMSRYRCILSRTHIWFVHQRHCLPYLVWYGDEIDVGVTLKDLGALGGDPSRVWDAQKCLSDMGIRFDTGSGCYGRDWEWDYSLEGPISVRFRCRAQRPERRTARPRPKLIISNETASLEQPSV